MAKRKLKFEVVWSNGTWMQVTQDPSCTMSGDEWDAAITAAFEAFNRVRDKYRTGGDDAPR